MLELFFEGAGFWCARGREDRAAALFYDFAEDAEESFALVFVALEQAGVEGNFRGELKLVFCLSRRAADQPYGTSSAIGSLDCAREELGEVFFAADVLLAQGSDFIDEALDAGARRFDGLFLSHEGEKKGDWLVGGGPCPASLAGGIKVSCLGLVKAL